MDFRERFVVDHVPRHGDSESLFAVSPSCQDGLMVGRCPLRGLVPTAPAFYVRRLAHGKFGRAQCIDRVKRHPTYGVGVAASGVGGGTGAAGVAPAERPA